MTTPSTIEPVDGPAAWLAADLEASSGWWHTFTAREIEGLDAALRHARAVSEDLDLAVLGAEAFPLGDVSALVDAIRAELVDGVGVMVCEGFPVDRYDEVELRAIWWGLSQHLGTPVAQSWRGDVLGDVRDLGTGIEGRTGRGYTSNVELKFHSDPADVTALFFLQRAKRGGESRLASSVATHNEIARRRPDLLELLYQPFTVSWQANEPPGEQPWYEMPVYGRNGADVACAYVASNILWAEKNCGAPPLAPQQVEAVLYVAEVAAEPQFWIERALEPGSMLLVNNHTAFHMRTEFEDFDDPARRRHLLRTWLSLPNSRRLPESFAPFFGDVGAGAVRGGYRSRDGGRRFATVTS
jgi:TfdA family taurine catabolism dioxygenase TauD